MQRFHYRAENIIFADAVKADLTENSIFVDTDPC